MGNNESVPDPSGSADGRRLPGDRSVWELPPTEWHASDTRVRVRVPDDPDVWSSAPLEDPTLLENPPRKLREASAVEASVVVAEAPVDESPVEWNAIIEDLQRDVAEVPVIEAETEIALEAELVFDVAADVNETGPLAAVLTIRLGPAFPGNVHVYDITLDPYYGTFTGVATSANNIPGETISGALSVGNTDIDFTAVYPVPAYEYAWFGTGPLGKFTGGDSLGNVLDALCAAITLLPDEHDDASVEDLSDEAQWLPVEELPVAMTVLEGAPYEVADELATDDSIAPALVADAVPDALDVPVSETVAVVPSADVVEPDVDDLSAADGGFQVAEIAAAHDEIVELEVVPEVAIAVVVNETPDVVVTEPEPEPEPETQSEDVPVHGAGCQCLSCRWSAFDPVPVTEGPFAGKAFYFPASKLAVPNEASAEPSLPEPADEHEAKAAHSGTRGKRRSVSSRPRR